MVKVTREENHFVFEIEGTHKLWAFKSRLEIPARDITGVRRDPGVFDTWKRLRFPGTYVPELLTAGTFYYHDKRVFWDVHNRDRVVAVELDHEDYDELVIEVSDPDRVIAMLKAA